MQSQDYEHQASKGRNNLVKKLQAMLSPLSIQPTVLDEEAFLTWTVVVVYARVQARQRRSLR
jgi:hypothetical protein